MRAITAEADDELITVVGGLPHGFRVGERVEFIRLTGGTGLSGRPKLTEGPGSTSATGNRSSAPTRYFVETVPSRSTFTVEATVGGGAVNITADATAGWVRRYVRKPGDA